MRAWACRRGERLSALSTFILPRLSGVRGRIFADADVAFDIEFRWALDLLEIAQFSAAFPRAFAFILGADCTYRDAMIRAQLSGCDILMVLSAYRRNFHIP